MCYPVALITFNTNAKVVCTLSQSTSMTALQTCVNFAAYTPGLTWTARALVAAQTQVFVSSAGDRSSAPDLLFLITDGRNTPGTDNPSIPASQLRGAGVRIFGVGTNKNADLTSFLAQLTGSPQQVFQAASFATLQGLLPSISSAVGSCSSLDKASTVQNYMILHMSNMAANGTVTSVNLYTNTGVMARAADFMQRSGCSFDWVSQPFTCPAQIFAVVVNGFDGQGYVFQRIALTQCFGYSGEDSVLDLNEPLALPFKS